MYVIVLIFSCLLLGSVALESPLAVYKQWAHSELANVFLVFLSLTFLGWISKKVRATYLLPLSFFFLFTLLEFNIAAVASVALIAFTAAVAGSWMIRKCTLVDDNNSYTNIGMSLSIGYALLIGILQLSVHFAINTYQIYICFFFFVLLTLHKEAMILLKEIVHFCTSKFDLPIIKFVMPCAMAVCILVYVAFPETHSDALMVNLHIANQIKSNSIWSFNILTEVWALWPKGAAWLHAAHYVLAGEMAARLFNWFAVIATTLIACTEAARLGYIKNVWVLAALYLSTPITFWCGFVLFDDAVFCLLLVATLVFTVNASKTLTPGKLFVISLLSSAAIATKVSGLFLIPIVLFIFFYRLLFCKDTGKLIFGVNNTLKYSISFLTFIVLGLVSYIFAFMKTGNPLFPLYNDFFRSEGFPFVRFEDARWYAGLGLTGIYKVTANTSLFSEGKNWTLGLQYGLFFIPVVAEFYFQRKNTDVILYGISALIFSILVFNQIHYVRYLYPIFPIYCLLIVSFISRVSSKSAQLLVLLSAFLCVFINLLNVKSLNMYYHFDFVGFSNTENRQFANYSEKELNNYINVDYGPSAVVLYIHRPYSANLNGQALKYHWTSPVIKADIDEIKEASDLRKFIVKYHITHVIWDRELFKSVPLEFYKLLPNFATLQKNVSTAELWRVDSLPVLSGSVISINKSEVLDMLKAGWMTPEVWGAWAKGEVSTFEFRLLPEDIKSYLHMKAKVMPYAPKNRLDDLIADVFVNNVFIKQITFKPIQQFVSIDIDIPKKVLSSKLMTIEFKFPKPFDKSALQLGFSEVSFDYE